MTASLVILMFLAFAHPGSCVCEEPSAGAAEEPDGAAETFDHEFDDEFGEEFDDEFADEDQPGPSDPLRLYNRFMFHVNDKLYFFVVRPIAKGYRTIVPEGGRMAVNRFFKNLAFPVRLVNNTLQGKFKNAGVECARFGVNTTVGVLGFCDPARSRLDLEPRQEDFGQTLGCYRVGAGCPLVLPVVGPSNLRDALARVPDCLLNPVNYVDPGEASPVIHTYERENYTSLHIGEYESLKKDALDPYTFLRDAYRQNREKAIEE